MTESRPTAARSARWGDALAVLLLLALIVLFFRRFLFSGLILIRGDMFLYFYPYWDARNAALAAGRIPQWNPLLFTGAPFLANSQAGVLYPLNWPLAPFDAPTAVKLSAALHTGIAAIGAYLFGRRAARLSVPAAFLVGLTFAFGGYFTAQLEHINQFQGLAWLPWLFWLLSEAVAGQRRAIPALALVFALQILAGHTQTVFISGVGLGVWALWQGFVPWPFRRSADDAPRPGWLRPTLKALSPVGMLALGAILAAALAAAQLLPTFQLTSLSNREGGLPFREAVSFSLRPHLIGRAFLPNYSGEALFSEYVAYVGVIALMLAVVGLWANRRDRRVLGLGLLAALGLFFAAGAYNPVYWGLVRFVPGFDLFRAPARWLALTALGTAALAGTGLDTLARPADEERRPWLLIALPVATIVVLAAGSFLAARVSDLVPGASAPALPELLRWGLTALLAAVLIAVGRRRLLNGITPLLLIVLVGGELYLASATQPFNDLSAPAAWTSQRPAISTMLATNQDQIVPDRYLSLSDTLFDPGDLHELEAVFDPLLTDDALFDFIVATKQQEILAPNLSMSWGIPALDGFDGGVLPLQAYTRFTELFAEGEAAPDGRLREYLDTVPDLVWLRQASVRWIITDKVFDAWLGNVYYDLQFPQSAADTPAFVARPSLPFEATAVGIVGYVSADHAPGEVVAQVEVVSTDGESLYLDVVAGEHLAGSDADSRAQAFVEWDDPLTVQSLTIRYLPGVQGATVQGMTLVDQRTGAFVSTTLSADGALRLAQSGDVKIYEDAGAHPRAYLVCQPRATTDPDEAYRWLADDPQTPVLITDVPFATVADCNPAAPGTAQIVSYEPERVVIQATTVNDAAYLILTDAWYPGWSATVDGQEANVFRANGLFRAVRVPRGSHQIVLTYQNRPFEIGAVVSLIALIITLGAIILIPASRRPDPPATS